MNSKPAIRSSMRRRALAAVACGTALAMLAACGGGSYGGGGASNNTPLMPVITTAPASMTVTAGQPATFSVVANGFSPLAYQWTRNNVDITGATQPTYTLAAATAADSGAMFAVKVSNTYGSVTSASATLTVQ